MRMCNAECTKKVSKRFQLERGRQGISPLEVITLWNQSTKTKIFCVKLNIDMLLQECAADEKDDGLIEKV